MHQQAMHAFTPGLEHFVNILYSASIGGYGSIADLLEIHPLASIPSAHRKLVIDNEEEVSLEDILRRFLQGQGNPSPDFPEKLAAARRDGHIEPHVGETGLDKPWYRARWFYRALSGEETTRVGQNPRVSEHP